MATRQDIDDILNNLMGDDQPDKKPAAPAKKSASRSKIDDMSVEDLLNSLTSEKKKTDVSANELADAVSQEFSGDLHIQKIIEKKKKAEEEAKAAAEAAKKKAEEEAKAAAEAAKKKAEEEAKAAAEAVKKKAEEEAKAAAEAAKKKAEEEAKAAKKKSKKKSRKKDRNKPAATPETESADENSSFAPEIPEASEISDEPAISESDSDDTEISPVLKIEEEIISVSEEPVEEVQEDIFGFAENPADATAEDESDDIDALLSKALEISKENEESDDNNNADDEDPAQKLIESLQSDAEKTISDIENSGSDDESSDHENEEPAVSEENEDNSDAAPESEEDESAEEEAETPARKKGGVIKALENILDEEPEEIMNERSEKAEASDDQPKKAGAVKKVLLTLLGVVFSILACIGLITVIFRGIDYFNRFSSGDTKKDGFTEVVYPAVIMDIESFESPSELPSDQIITAAIWSIVMDSDAIRRENLEITFDTVTIPDTVVEKYAVKLFGDDLPEFNHTTTGPAGTAHFYYNSETKAYNVPVKPITFTYQPDVKSVSKNGTDYIVTVDYINEVPSWIDSSVAKTVEYGIVETNSGYQIKSMRIISASTL